MRLAGRLGLPGLLLYLLLGLGLGSMFPALHVQDAELATVLGYSALVLILAQGGLTTRMSPLRPVMWPAIALASVGYRGEHHGRLRPAHLLLDVPAQIALLLGAVLAATDAAAVFSVMRRMRISERMRTLLEAEAGFNDAPVVVLVSVVASGAFGTTPSWQLPRRSSSSSWSAAPLWGSAFGYAARWLLPRLALPAVGLYPIAALAMLVAAYGAAAVVHVSGFMAVYLAAVLIGSTSRLPHRRSIVGFADGLAWIAEIGLFFMLGALADVGRLPSAVPARAGRPGRCWCCSPGRWLRSRPWRRSAGRPPTIVFAAVAGLRGAVPIVFAAIPLAAGVEGADLVFDVTLLVVLVLMLVQTPMLAPLGRRLGVVLPDEAFELELESAPLDGMRAQVLGIEVPPGSGFVGTFVMEIGLPEGAVVALVVRGGRRSRRTCTRGSGRTTSCSSSRPRTLAGPPRSGSARSRARSTGPLARALLVRAH